jgi:hypothetical protein
VTSWASRPRWLVGVHGRLGGVHGRLGGVHGRLGGAWVGVLSAGELSGQELGLELDL